MSSTDLELMQFRRKALGLRHTSPLVTLSCHCRQTSIACCAVCAGSLSTTAWNRSPTIALQEASGCCAGSSCFGEALVRSGNKLTWREAGRVPCECLGPPARGLIAKQSPVSLRDRSRSARA